MYALVMDHQRLALLSLLHLCQHWRRAATIPLFVAEFVAQRSRLLWRMRLPEWPMNKSPMQNDDFAIPCHGDRPHIVEVDQSY